MISCYAWRQKNGKKRFDLKRTDQKKLRETVRELQKTGRLAQQKNAIQHGTTTVFQHSLRVAGISLALAGLLRLRVDRDALLRGALLHDYFLYDWHKPHDGHDLHGFFHPRAALANAKQDFALTPKEENIILRHMFPLTLIPPACREGWLVCAADKYCALTESAAPYLHLFSKKKKKTR